MPQQPHTQPTTLPLDTTGTPETPNTSDSPDTQAPEAPDAPQALHCADVLLDDLTAPQRQAVEHVDGPLLILAAAGSGKTRTITRRIAHLILRVGIAPWQVLAITFTNKAALEMRQRAQSLLSPKQARAANIYTFHSFCARCLREFGSQLNLPPSYCIYDTADQTQAIKQALTQLDINASNFPPGNMRNAISQAKNDLLDAKAFAAKANDFYDRTVAKVFTKYEQILKKNNALDFDDLLLKTVELMRRFPDVLQAMRQQYQYILIDEYQDTNHAQFIIAHTLASEHRNLCCTGDPDQSIYSWRGADIQNILDFESHYTDAKVIRLEQNYRSTKNILAVADQLIGHNVKRKHKDLWTENEQGQRITVACCYDQNQEATYVVEQLQEQLNAPQGQAQAKRNWSDMAIFYRTNSLSRSMEDALRQAGVPYQIARGTAFYDRKEIKDALSFLRVIANPADEVNLLRIINTPARGISSKSVKALQTYAVSCHMRLYDALEHAAEVPLLNARAQNAVVKFHHLIQDWQNDLSGEQNLSLRRLVERVLQESDLEAHYRNDKSDPDHERIANLGELISSAQQFDEEYDFAHEQNKDANTSSPLAVPLATLQPILADKLINYLQQVSLVSDIDNLDAGQGAVTLMTLHAAKGLEFPVVAMIGVEDNLLPHAHSQETTAKLEEERRLCFVGITRAQKKLILTYTRFRSLFGKTTSSIPSRFLNELPEDFLDQQQVGTSDTWPSHRRGNLHHAQGTDHDDEDTVYYADDDDSALPIGSQVRHRQFGLGKVLAVSRQGRCTRARINFATAGPKTLILEYANLELLT